MKCSGMALLLVGLPRLVFGCAVVTPEINVASGVGALARLGGAVLVIRGRRKH
jgi:hypothetical protein